jgi:hypothetical protein
MDRRQFMFNLVIGGLSFATAAKAFGQVSMQSLQITISNNHGHALVLSDKDIRDGANHQYDIEADSSHSHLVQITKEQFAQILKGQPVQVTSSTAFGHAHKIDIRLKA